MARSAADIQAIKDEFTNDPKDLSSAGTQPYLAFIHDNDAANASAMNLSRSARGSSFSWTIFSSTR